MFDNACAKNPKLFPWYQKRVWPLFRKKYPLWGRMIMISLTYDCQCRCQHCGSALFRDKIKKELTKNEVVNLINDARKLGSRLLYFFGGEPLLVPDLIYYIKYAKEKGFSIKLDTNGLLLSENKVRELKQAGLDIIGVSIDSPDEAAHDKLRGIPGIFRKALIGLEYCKKYGLAGYISAYATKENLRNGELKNIIKLAKGLGIETRLLSSICSGKWINHQDLVLSAEEKMMLKQLLEKNKVFWEAVDFDHKDIRYTCPALEKRFFNISAYGDVSPCCYLPVSFGNIRNEPLEVIIRKMWVSKMFFNQEECGDCLANSESFTRAYAGLINSDNQYPVDFRQCFPENPVEEWDNWAPAYNKEVDCFLGLNYNLICSKISFKGKRVLDVGCGTGLLAGMIAQEAKHITLLDFSSKMLEEASKELKDFSNIDFKHADIEKISFSPEEKFDVIILVFLAHHLKNISPVIEKLKSCLTHHGQIIILDHLDAEKKDRYLFYREIIKKYGLLKFFQMFYFGTFSNTLLKQHLLREKRMTRADFQRKFEALLPGADIRIVNGIFVILEWRRQSGPTLTNAVVLF